MKKIFKIIIITIIAFSSFAAKPIAQQNNQVIVDSTGNAGVKGENRVYKKKLPKIKELSYLGKKKLVISRWKTSKKIIVSLITLAVILIPFGMFFSVKNRRKRRAEKENKK